jgi:hypothetical protein
MNRLIDRINLVLAFILILMIGYLLFTENGHRAIDFILNRGSNNAINNPPVVRYTCSAVTAQTAYLQEATCTDCTNFPVDKLHRLPATYAPYVVDTHLAGGGELVPPAVPPLRNLFGALRDAGYSPSVTSAYRSYEDQVETFNSWVYREYMRSGNIGLALAAAERYSAWPGHSEHQLGTTVDVNCSRCVPFDTADQRNVALWKYLEKNAHLYGFVISYPRNMEAETGYQYEPWHLRYVGVEAATALHDQQYTEGNGVCLNALLKARQP